MIRSFGISWWIHLLTVHPHGAFFVLLILDGQHAEALSPCHQENDQETNAPDERRDGFPGPGLIDPFQEASSLCADAHASLKEGSMLAQDHGYERIHHFRLTLTNGWLWPKRRPDGRVSHRKKAEDWIRSPWSFPSQWSVWLSASAQPTDGNIPGLERRAALQCLEELFLSLKARNHSFS